MQLTFRTYRGKAILKMVENLLKEGNVIRSPEYGNVVDGIYGGSPEGIKLDPPADIRGIGMDRLAGSCGYKTSFKLFVQISQLQFSFCFQRSA